MRPVPVGEFKKNFVRVVPVDLVKAGGKLNVGQSNGGVCTFYKVVEIFNDENSEYLNQFISMGKSRFRAIPVSIDPKADSALFGWVGDIEAFLEAEEGEEFIIVTKDLIAESMQAELDSFSGSVKITGRSKQTLLD